MRRLRSRLLAPIPVRIGRGWPFLVAVSVGALLEVSCDSQTELDQCRRGNQGAAEAQGAFSVEYVSPTGVRHLDFEPRVLGSRAESVSIVGCALEGDDEDMVFHLGLGWGGLTARQINNVSTHGEHTISANLDGHRMEPRPGLYDYTARGAVTNYSPSEGRLVAHGLIKSHPVFKPGELWFEVDIKWNPNDFPDPSGSGGGGDGGGASSGKGGAAGAGGEAGASGSSGFAGIGGLAGEGGQ